MFHCWKFMPRHHLHCFHRTIAVNNLLCPIREMLMLIQPQGGNNLADLTTETVWVEKLGMFQSNIGLFTFTWCSAFDYFILLMCSGYSIKIGDVIACWLWQYLLWENVLDILTLKHAENDGIDYILFPCFILIIFSLNSLTHTSFSHKIVVKHW